MKVLLGVFFVFFTFFNAHAQIFASARLLDPQRTASPLIVNSVKRTQYYVPGLRMRNAGTVFTVLGSGLMAGAIAVYNNGNPNTITGYRADGSAITDQDDHHDVGREMFFIGTSMLIPGVILWVKGASKYNKNIYKETAIKLRPTGLVVSYKF